MSARVGQPLLIGAGIAIAAALAIAANRMRWPVMGTITSPFGAPRASGPHNGVDIAAPIGTPVRAPFAGTVLDVYTHPRGGLSLILRMENGMTAGFAHLGTVAVAEGDSVGKGVTLGTVGVTGVTTGPHLHFTLRNLDGAYVDPEIYLG